MKIKGFAFCVLMAATGLASIHAHAQGAPPFNNLRFEEDWSKFPPEGAGGPFDAVKKIDISDTTWLSVGGEIRLRVESWNNFGFSPANEDKYLLYRLFLHTDWHFGDHWRIFSEFRFTDITSRNLPGGQRDALDADEGDIWNVFAEARYPVGDLDLTFRFGRQELQFGREVLISPLDWSNNRRIFDGVRLRLKGDAWQFDAFVTKPVFTDADSINKTDHNRLFSGLYYTRKIKEGKYGFDAYVLAINRIQNSPRKEERYTIGGRIYGKPLKNLSFEFESAFQVGNLGKNKIFAFMVLVEGTYTFSETKGKPWITLGFDYASGDRNPFDDSSQTFSQLFPLGHAYFGYIDAVGRQNIVDARMTVGAWAKPGKVRVKGDVHFFWLAESEDGLYNAGGALTRPGITVAPNGARVKPNDDQVGVELDLTVLHKVNRYFTILYGYSHFIAKGYLEQTGLHDNIDFLYTQLAFQF